MQKSVYEFISKQTSDSIVERRTCAVSGQPFAIFQSDLDFFDKISPIFNGKKFSIPAPKLCPTERQRRRMMFRNERKLYKRKCDATGKDIIAMYAPNAPYKVYERNFWRGDARDPMKYGKAFDFNKSFTQQFGALIQEVPRANLYGKNNENSEYTNHCNFSKDSYMCADLVEAERCAYTTTGMGLDIVDCNAVVNCTNVYACIDSTFLFNCSYCMQCNNCTDCHGLINCERCEYCINSSNLVDGKRYIDNIKHTKEEYEQKMKQRANDFPSVKFGRAAWITNSPGCYGNQIFNSNKVAFGYLIYDSNGVKYSFTSGWMNDSYDCYETGINCSLLYENHAVMGSSNVLFASISYENKNCLYIDNCYNSENLFGCVGLRNKQYCIFNKQYTKVEYEKLVPKIIKKMESDGERGEFFHPSLSLFAYNESVANEYLPLTREDALARGYRWQDKVYDPSIPKGAEYVKCEVSGRPFRLIKLELDFYRKNNLPLPRRHPDVRHMERMHMKPGRELSLRACDKCGKEMPSVYPTNSKFKVYCQTCYNKEVYG